MEKKILIIIPYFIPAYSYGGPVKVAYDHAIGLIKHGYNVTVVTTDALDAKSRNYILNEVIDQIRIIRFKNLSNYFAKFFNLYLPLGLKEWLKNNIKDYGVVHIHDFFTILTILGVKYANKNGIKYFIQPHGSANFNIERGKSFIKQKFFKYFGNRILEESRGIISVSENEKKEIHFLGSRNHIRILLNGINFSELDNYNKQIDIDKEKEFRKKYGIEGKKIILSIGRLHRIKRFDKLIEYSKEFLLNNTNIILFIIGPDEGEMNNLNIQIKKLKLEGKVILSGGLYGIDKYIAYKISNLFVLASDSEGLSMTILDAIYYDKPLLLSKGCNIDFKEEGINIFNNKEEFNINLENIIKNNFNKYSYKFKEQFNINTCISNLIKLYNE